MKIYNEECILAPILVVVTVIVFIWLLINSSRTNQEIKETRKQLIADGYTEIQCNAKDGCNTAELLAIKRCDIKYGPGNYTFTSTNFNGSVWYKAHKK